MRQLIIFQNLTLDGVIQAPGRPDEDTRDGFTHGGWATPYNAMQSKEAGESLAHFDTLLLGRRTYEDFFSFWTKQSDNPFTQLLNNMQKYVASTTLKEPLAWQNTSLLNGNIQASVTELKSQGTGAIVVMGSGAFIQTLIRHDLIDRYVLLIHPIVLGTGRRLFPEGEMSINLDLIKAKATPNHVIVATYQPVQTRSRE